MLNLLGGVHCHLRVDRHVTAILHQQLLQKQLRIDTMAETDPVTGLPKSEVEKKSDIEKYNRFSGQKTRADQLVEDLGSEKGQLILNKIKEHLLNRVNTLIEQDGECKALKKVLVDMGLTVNVGEMAIEKLLKLVMRKSQ